MSTVTWLHLSDLHLRSEAEFDSKIVRKALLDDIERCRSGKYSLEPDFIVFTGDIAYSSQPAQYEQAKTFFDQLLAITRLTKKKLFIIPGNHDVDRSAINGILARNASSILRKRERVIEFWEDSEDRIRMFRRFRHFETFVNEYFGVFHPGWTLEQPYYVHTLSIHQRNILIAGLNTAWMCGSENEKGNLLVGEPQARWMISELERLRGKNRIDYRICLHHHPLTWMQEFDEPTVRRLLMENFDVFLRGHLHDTDLERTIKPGQEALTIAAGALYDRESGAQTPFSYNYVRLDFTGDVGEVFLRAYAPKNDSWHEDHATYQNMEGGKWSWKLSETATTLTEPETSRILFVEDDDNWREIVSESIDLSNYRTGKKIITLEVAKTFADAQRMCDELHPDLLIVDIQLSKKPSPEEKEPFLDPKVTVSQQTDGPTGLELIKQTTMPVIVLAGDTTIPADNFARGRMIQTMKKSKYDPEELNKLIRQILRLRPHE